MSRPGEALTGLVLPIFEINREFYSAAEQITASEGITPAQWQVLMAVAGAPLTVAEIARRIRFGLARQSVQRTADLLVEAGWAQYLPNPGHRRAKLLEPTASGREIAARIAERQRVWSDALGAAVGVQVLEALQEKLSVLAEAAKNQRIIR